MAAGDSTRVWFPAMLEELERRWRMTLSWEECAKLCDQMTAVRTEIRRARDLKGPRLFCRHCQEVHEMNLGPITIRSMLFALRKRGLLTDKELTEMDVRWRRYRAEHRLDGCGKKRAEPDGAPKSRPPVRSPTSPGVPSSDSQRTSSSGGCG